MTEQQTQTAKTETKTKPAPGGAASPTDKAAKVTGGNATTGRIVHYYDETRFKDTPLAAIVTAANPDKTVNLTIFNIDGSTFVKHGVCAADPVAAVGTRKNVWAWPAKV